MVRLDKKKRVIDIGKKEIEIKFKASTSEFDAGIKKINSNISTLNAQLKLNDTQLKGNSNDVSLLKEKQQLLAAKLQDSKEKVSLTNEKLTEARKIYGEDSEEVQKYTRQLLAAERQEVSVKNALEQCTAELNKNESNLKEAETAYNNLEKTIQSQESELKLLKTEYINATLEEGKNSEAAKELAAEIEKLNNHLVPNKDKLDDAEKAAEGLTTDLKDTGEAAQTSANGGFTVMKGVLADLVSNGIQVAGNVLKDFAKSIIETGSEFDSSMSQVGAISGATGEEFVKLRNKAQEMGATTKFTATESAEAMNYMAMAGWDSEQMLDGLPGILNLAAASGEDLATTSDIVTDALTAFGMKAEESGHFADIMAAASASANTNVSMLGESFKYVAPVAGALGYSAEDTSVALGLMANAGIKASQGGTALRTILTNLSKPTDEVSAAMDKMGISLDDGNGNVKSLNDLMLDLRSAFGEMKIPLEEYMGQMEVLDENLQNGLITQKMYDQAVEDITKKAYGAEGALQAEAAATIAGKQGMAGLLAIVNASDEDFGKLTNAVNEATDAESGYSAATEMASEMQDNLKGDITLMQSGLDGLRQHIFDDLNEPMREATQTITGKVIPAAQNLYDGFKQGISWIAENKAAIGGVLIVIGSLTAGIAAYNIVAGIESAMTAAETTSLWGLVGAKMADAKAQLAVNAAMLASPITWVVAAVVGLVAGFIYLWNTSEEFRGFWTGLWDDISGWCSGKIEGVKNAISGIGEKLTGMKNTVSEKFEEIKGKAGSYLSEVEDTFTSNGGGIKGAAAVYMKFMTDEFKLGYNALNKLTGGRLGETVKVASEKFSEMKNKTKECLSSMKDTFEKNGGGIKGAAAVYMEGINNAFATGYNALNKLTGGKLDDLTKKASAKIEGFKNKFKDGIDKIKDFFDFHIEWPHIKSPSLTVTYNTENTLAKAAKLLGFPGMPKFNIKWNAEGAILKRPTIFGFANGMLQGGGEAGQEAVLPIEKLEQYIGNKMAEFLEFIPSIDYDKLAAAIAKENAKQNIKIVLNNRELGRAMHEVM